MKITPNQPFLDGPRRFEPDQEYDVDDRDGARFVGSGWATSPEYALPGTGRSSSATSIQPDDVTHPATARET